MLATALGGTTALIDTEHESASLYADKFPFDTKQLTEFSLRTYIDSIAEAATAGYANLIIDSLSHAWTGKGGALEQVDRGGGNRFTNGWKAVTPLYNQLIESILSYPGNIIATMRSKMAYEVEIIQGKSVPKKLGMAPVIREGSEYEFTFVLDLNNEGNVTVAKTRCMGAVFTVGEVFGRTELTSLRLIKLQQWMSSGAALGAKDELREAIRMAGSDIALTTLIPRLKALSETEREELRPLYEQRKAELLQMTGGTE
jgi:hypothetical protein